MTSEIMDSAEFDRFADEYEVRHRANIAITGESPEFFAVYKIAEFAGFARDRPAGSMRILDFGAGIGNSIPFFRRYFPAAQLTCADPSARSIELSRQRFPDQNNTRCSLDAKSRTTLAPSIWFSQPAFSITFPTRNTRIGSRNCYGSPRPGGMLTIFEHNPLNP